MRYLIDGNLNFLKSNGETEENFNDIENYNNFINKFQKAKAITQVNIQPLSIISAPNVYQTIHSGNWKIFCSNFTQLIFVNCQAKYREILIKLDMPIFTVVCDDEKRFYFSAKTILGNWLFFFFSFNGRTRRDY